MTKFFGKVGYTTPTEVTPYVYEDVITEREYAGDELRKVRTFVQGESILGEVSSQQRISVLADAYALENYEDIRYVIGRSGTPMTVTSVEVERPRLILLLGEKYNGPLPEPEVDDAEDG